MASDSIILTLGQQVECYRKLSKLAAAQHEHVQRSETEALLAVLQKRQEVLEQIGELERVLSPVKRQWREYLGRLDGGSRERAEQMMVETRMLLEQITAADRNDALVLQQRKVELGQQIKQATSSRQVNRSYAAAAYGSRPSNMDVQR